MSSFEQYRTRSNTCVRCGHELDGATNANDEGEPTPGAVSLCLYCGNIAMFTDDLTFRPPTSDEWQSMIDSTEFLHILIVMHGIRASRRLGN